MRARLLAGISATLLVVGSGFAAVQDDSAAQEAKRQSVAKSKTDSSPAQTMRQAIAFERYKDLASERQARKDAGHSNTADRSKNDAAPVRKKTRK